MQEIYDSIITDTFSFKKVGSLLIRKKLKQQGIEINDEQLTRIEEQLAYTDGDHFSLNIDDGSEELTIKNVDVDLNDPDELNKIIQTLTDAITEVTPNIVSDTTKTIHEHLKGQVPEITRETQVDRRKFISNLEKEWGESFRLLEAYIALVIEAGGDFNNEFRSQASNEQNFVFEALTRLHARACQVSSEVMVLIKNGFADGADARWRSLHEITVVAIFIKENGNNVAEKYLLHNHIESFKAAQEFRKHYQALGETPITEANLSDIKEVHDKLIERFGKDYGNNLGWASETLKNRDPKINHIEAAIGLEHMRPYYRLASHNVHANPKGIFLN